MKALFPIVTLAIGGIWLAHQRKQISDLQKENLHITKHLTTAQSTHHSTNRRSRKTSLTRKLPAWPQVAQQLQANNFEGGIYKISLKLEDQLQQLSAPELITALKEAEDSKLDKKSLLHLTQYLLRRLVKLDPSHIVLNPSSNPLTSLTWRYFQTQAVGDY